MKDKDMNKLVWNLALGKPNDKVSPDEVESVLNHIAKTVGSIKPESIEFQEELVNHLELELLEAKEKLQFMREEQE